MNPTLLPNWVKLGLGRVDQFVIIELVWCSHVCVMFWIPCDVVLFGFIIYNHRRWWVRAVVPGSYIYNRVFSPIKEEKRALEHQKLIVRGV